jgi:hypothetical protein
MVDSIRLIIGRHVAFIYTTYLIGAIVYHTFKRVKENVILTKVIEREGREGMGTKHNVG